MHLLLRKREATRLTPTETPLPSPTAMDIARPTYVNDGPHAFRRF